MKVVWLTACYPGEFTIDSNGVWSWRYDEGDDKGKSFPFRAPKKKSFMELYGKVVENLQIDSNKYEIVLRCHNPKSSKGPPFEIRNDESVVWLLSTKEPPTIYITLKLKANVLVGSNSTMKSMHNVGRDINVETEQSVNDNVEEDCMWQHEDSEAFVNHNCGVAESSEVIERNVGSNSTLKLMHNAKNDINFETELSLNHNVEEDCMCQLEVGEVFVKQNSGAPESLKVVEVVEGDKDAEFDECNTLLETLEDSFEPENIIGGVVHSLGDATTVTEADMRGDSNDDVNQSLTTSQHVFSSRIPNKEDFYVNKCFPTKNDLKRRLQTVAVEFHFEYKTRISNKKNLIVVCAVEGCPWFLNARCIGSSTMFVVREYGSVHSCPFCIQKTTHKQLTYKMVAEMIWHKFQDPKCKYPPKEIANDFERKYGYKLSIATAFNARKHAMELVRGNATDGYGGLPSFFHSLKMANPDTKTSIVTTKMLIPDTNIKVDAFKYCFMALGQSIHGFSSSIRPVICVDGTFLSCTYRGVLLTAVCMDGHKQLYPLAFAVVDSENNKSWTYFFKKLKSITGDSHDLVILSDQAKSIENGFQKVFKKARHGICTFHLKKNLQSKFPRCNIDLLWERTYKAYTVREFKLYFDLLCSKRVGIRSYLPPHKFHYWSRAHFDGHRYEMMTTNNAESLNSLLVQPRGFPIVALLKEIRAILQQWYADRYIDAMSCTTRLTPTYEKKMAKRYNQMRQENPTAKVICPSYKWEVRVEQSSFVVDLDAYTCTCRRFDLKKFPCVHALYASRQPQAGKDVYSLCSKYFFTSCYRDAYSKFVYPNEQGLEYPSSVLDRKVMPPKMKKPSGRPATQRKRSAREKMKKLGKEMLAKQLENLEVQSQEQEPVKSRKQPIKRSRKQPIKNSRKKAKHCGEPEEQPGETSKEPPVEKRRKAKQCGEPEEQPGEKRMKKAKQSQEPEEQEQPGEPVNKNKKFASLSSLIKTIMARDVGVVPL